jgi:hypothetical protein
MSNNLTYFLLVIFINLLSITLFKLIYLLIATIFKLNNLNLKRYTND